MAVADCEVDEHDGDVAAAEKVKLDVSCSGDNVKLNAGADRHDDDGGGEQEDDDGDKEREKEQMAARNCRRSHRLKVVQSFALYFGFLTIGMSYSIVGPTLLDLEQTARTNTEEIAFIFIGRSIGGLVGACIAGAVFHRANRWLQLTASLMLMSVCVLVVPHIPNVIGLTVVVAVMAFGAGFFDTGGNMCLLHVWGSDNGPWMQALHTIFALGGLLAPLIAKPFLMEGVDAGSEIVESVNGENNETNTELLYNLTVVTGRDLNMTCNSTTSDICTLSTQVWKAYLIASSLSFLASIYLLAMFLYSCISDSEKGKTKNEQPDHEERVEPDKKFKVKMIVLVLFFYWFYCIVEITYGSYLFAYVVKYLSWSKATAADLCSAFWLAFTIGRAASIVLIKFVRPSVIIASGCVLLAGILAILLFIANYHPLVMWICNIIFSVVMAPIFGAGITWTEQYIEITGMVGSVFMIAGTAGDSVGPVIMGVITGKFGFVVFTYMLFPIAILTCITFGIMLVLGHQHGKRRQDIATLNIQSETANLNSESVT